MNELIMINNALCVQFYSAAGWSRHGGFHGNASEKWGEEGQMVLRPKPLSSRRIRNLRRFSAVTLANRK